MTIRYKTEMKKGFLLVHAEGSSESPEELLDYIDSLLAEPSSAQAGKLLLDHRDLEFERNNIGIYDLAIQCIERFPANLPLKVALLARPERMEYARIYESIGLSANVDIKAFDRLKMASVWLNA